MCVHDVGETMPHYDWIWHLFSEKLLCAFLLKRPILCLTGTTRALGWSGPYQGCWDNVLWSIHCSQCPRGHMTVWHSPSVTPPAPSQCTRGLSFWSVGWMLIINLKVVVTFRHSLVSTHLFAPLSVFLPGRQSLSIVWVCKEWAQSAQTKHWAAHFKLPDQHCVCVWFEPLVYSLVILWRLCMCYLNCVCCK